MTTRAPDAGFSLIEALVALVVLAVAGIAVVGTTETHIRRIAGLEDRAVAQWVAENRMAELAAGLHDTGEARAEVAMLGATWILRQSAQPTDDPDLTGIVVAVGAGAGAGDAMGGADASLLRLTGFLARGDE